MRALILLAVVVGLLLAVLKFLELRKQPGQRGGLGDAPVDDGDEAPSPDLPPYVPLPRLLTPAEAAFHQALTKAIEGPYMIMAQVQLSKLIAPKSGEPRWKAAQNKIDRKSADFVIVDANSWQPMLVIELNDWSHARTKRKERDAFVADALRQAGLKLLTYPAAQPFDIARISSEVMRTMLSQPAAAR